MAAVAVALFADGCRNRSALEILFAWLTYSAVLIHAAAQLKTSGLAFWLCVALVVLPVAAPMCLVIFLALWAHE
jgi:hypothetical protein